MSGAKSVTAAFTDVCSLLPVCASGQGVRRFVKNAQDIAAVCASGHGSLCGNGTGLTCGSSPNSLYGICWKGTDAQLTTWCGAPGTILGHSYWDTCI